MAPLSKLSPNKKNQLHTKLNHKHHDCYNTSVKKYIK